MSPSQQLAFEALGRAMERRSGYDFCQQVRNILVEKIGLGGEVSDLAQSIAADLCDWSIIKNRSEVN